MPNMSQEAAYRVWMAHREIATGKKLLADINDKVKWGHDATPLDPFGRRKAFSFGIPNGDNGQRLLDVSPMLAVYVIEAHIAAKEKELAEASIAARMELDGVAAPAAEQAVAK
jgi:hypothetical protein